MRQTAASRFPGLMGGTTDDRVQEHIADYLSDGWAIVSITPAAGGGSLAVAWLAVLLERN